MDKIKKIPYSDIAKIPENKVVDGKIDDFSQGTIGDCWFLSAVKELSLTPEGQQVIKESIKSNNDGSVSIKFKGDLKCKSYTVSKEELTSRTEFSVGDADTRALEIAADKYYKDRKSDLGSSTPLDESLNLLIGSDSKITYAAKVKGDGTRMSTDSNVLKNCKSLTKVSGSTAKDIDEIPLINEMLKKKSDNSELALTIGTYPNVKEDTGLYPSHAYSVKSVDYKKGIIELINPHNTTKVEIVKLKDFHKNFATAAIVEPARKELGVIDCVRNVFSSGEKSVKPQKYLFLPPDSIKTNNFGTFG